MEVALKSMNEGERSLITIDAQHAFGERGNEYGFHGRGKPIPKNSVLEFDLELIGWENESDSKEPKTNEEKLDLVKTNLNYFNFNLI